MVRSSLRISKIRSFSGVRDRDPRASCEKDRPLRVESSEILPTLDLFFQSIAVRQGVPPRAVLSRAHREHGKSRPHGFSEIVSRAPAWLHCPHAETIPDPPFPPEGRRFGDED